MVNGDEVCDDGVNDNSYDGCAADCLALGPHCGDAEVNGPESCDDDNDDSTDGCLGNCEVPTNCMDILDYDDQSADGVYAIDVDGDGDIPAFDVTCDMSTDGGGWTLCGNVDEVDLGGSSCVEESDAYVDAADMTNASFCALLFTDQQPAGMMIHNRTAGMDVGNDHKIALTWGDSPMTLYTYDNHAIQDCRNLTTDSVWADCQYASHQGGVWQNSAWSFTHSTLDNGYSGNYNRRITLGPTFLAGTQNCSWYSFGAETNATNIAGSWQTLENVGDLYLR